uniref:Uncharacterized protein n=1 Tax=Neospora caninum (strain Liverpool) TaxID=572307 RepID=A0A0F7UL23_NEOCL|nr:TPA: hypothetical protein BN1204_049310 [Neospora caninum Liverpool]
MHCTCSQRLLPQKTHQPPPQQQPPFIGSIPNASAQAARPAGKRMLYERTSEYLELNPGLDLDTAELEARRDFREVNEVHLSEKLTQTFEEMKKCYRLRYVLGRLNLMYELLKIEEHYNSLVADGKVHPANLGLFDSKIVGRMRSGEWFQMVSDILPSLDVLVDFTALRSGSKASQSPRSVALSRFDKRSNKTPSVTSSPKKGLLSVGNKAAPRAFRSVSSKTLSTPETVTSGRKATDERSIWRQRATPRQKQQTRACDRQSEPRGSPSCAKEVGISPLRSFHRSCSTCQKGGPCAESQSSAFASNFREECSPSVLRSPRSPPYLGTKGQNSLSKTGSHQSLHVPCEKASSTSCGENNDGHSAEAAKSELGACALRKLPWTADAFPSIASPADAAEDRLSASHHTAFLLVDSAMRDTPSSEESCHGAACGLFTASCSSPRSKNWRGETRALGSQLTSETNRKGGSANLHNSRREGAGGRIRPEAPSHGLQRLSTRDGVASGPCRILQPPMEKSQTAPREMQQPEKGQMFQVIGDGKPGMTDESSRASQEEEETAVTASTSRENTFERTSSINANPGVFNGPTAAAPLPRIPTKRGIGFGRFRMHSVPGGLGNVVTGMDETMLLPGNQKLPTGRTQTAFTAGGLENLQEKPSQPLSLCTSPAAGPAHVCRPATLTKQSCHVQQCLCHAAHPGESRGRTHSKRATAAVAHSYLAREQRAHSEVYAESVWPLRARRSASSTPPRVTPLPTRQTTETTVGSAAAERSGPAAFRNEAQHSTASIPLLRGEHGVTDNPSVPSGAMHQKCPNVVQPGGQFVESQSVRLLIDPSVRQLAEAASSSAARSVPGYNETDACQVRPDIAVPGQPRGVDAEAIPAEDCCHAHCQGVGQESAAPAEKQLREGCTSHLVLKRDVPRLCSYSRDALSTISGGPPPCFPNGTHR